MWQSVSLRRAQLGLWLPRPRLAWLRLGGGRVPGELLPIAAMLLLAAIALAAMRQHAELKATLQAEEISRLESQFRSGPVADAWRTLHDAWQREERRQAILLSRLSRLSGAAYAAALHNYRDFVIETVEEHRLARPIGVVLGFFRRLEVCVRVGHCLPDAAHQAFGDALRQFRNQHYYYLEAELSLAELNRVAEMIAPDAASVPAEAQAITMP